MNLAYNTRLTRLLTVLSFLFLLRSFDKIPSMLLSLAECSNLISVETLVNIDHYMYSDPAGQWLLHFITYYVDWAVHIVLFLSAVMILIQTVPALGRVYENMCQTIKNRINSYKRD
jgi:Mn2+/Fe2+ NRAMP family transporter